MGASDCFICAKHRAGDAAQGGAAFDDGLIYVGHAHLHAGSAYRGYLMVEPKRHVSGLGHLGDEEAAHLGVMINRAAAALRDLTGAEHVYSFVFGDSVPHLHAHVAPRYPGTPQRYWGARLREWPAQPLAG